VLPQQAGRITAVGHPPSCIDAVEQVPGTAGEEYITMDKSYCSCQAHYYEVVSKSEAPYVSAGAVAKNCVCTLGMMLRMACVQLIRPPVQ